MFITIIINKSYLLIYVYKRTYTQSLFTNNRILTFLFQGKRWFPTSKAYCKFCKSDTCLCPWLLKFFSGTKYFDYKSNEISNGHNMSTDVNEQRDVWFDQNMWKLQICMIRAADALSDQDYQVANRDNIKISQSGLLYLLV